MHEGPLKPGASAGSLLARRKIWQGGHNSFVVLIGEGSDGGAKHLGTTRLSCSFGNSLFLEKS
ncbi:MAG: hypothetical protein KatS3mg112_0093 [Thermogutta sp.]|nr:MAG: hypothetical protein KatS3mg112_0093 [Thermogutta sp.]